MVTASLEPRIALVWKCLGFVHLGNNVIQELTLGETDEHPKGNRQGMEVFSVSPAELSWKFHSAEKSLELWLCGENILQEQLNPNVCSEKDASKRPAALSCAWS